MMNMLTVNSTILFCSNTIIVELLQQLLRMPLHCACARVLPGARGAHVHLRCKMFMALTRANSPMALTDLGSIVYEKSRDFL